MIYTLYVFLLMIPKNLIGVVQQLTTAGDKLKAIILYIAQKCSTFFHNMHTRQGLQELIYY